MLDKKSDHFGCCEVARCPGRAVSDPLRGRPRAARARAGREGREEKIVKRQREFQREKMNSCKKKKDIKIVENS